MESDVIDLVKNLKSKIVLAAALIMAKRAKKEGVSAVQYTKAYQETYVKQNENKIDEIILKRYLCHCKEEFLQKLRKSISVAVVPSNIIEDEDDLTLFGGGSLDWFENPSPPYSSVVSIQEYSTSKTTPEEKVFDSEVFSMKHLNFIESLMMLREESERNSPIPTNLLYSLLYDETESHNFSLNDREFSEDSGIGSSDQLSEDNHSISYVSSDIVRFAIQSSNTQQIVLNSMKLVLKHVKRELSINIERVFFNWKGSLEEYTFKLLRECSVKNVECKDMLLNLIFHLLEGIWTDKRLQKHFQWELKIHLVNILISDCEDCYEVLQYISERLDYLIRRLCHKSNDTQLILEKLCHFLNLYSRVCQKLKKMNCILGDKTNELEEDGGDVTKLWQNMWCQKGSDSETKSVLLSAIDEDQVQVLERLIIIISKRYPIVASLAKESLKHVYELVTKESPDVSNYFT